MAERAAMLIDYEYCVGCCDCEIACMEEHGYGPDRMGIKVQKLGPWRSPEDGWQYDFVPLVTDWCDMCERRAAANNRPACQDACSYSAIKTGTLDQMEDFATIKGKQLLIIR